MNLNIFISFFLHNFFNLWLFLIRYGLNGWTAFNGLLICSLSGLDYFFLRFFLFFLVVVFAFNSIKVVDAHPLRQLTVLKVQFCTEQKWWLRVHGCSSEEYDVILWLSFKGESNRARGIANYLKPNEFIEIVFFHQLISAHASSTDHDNATKKTVIVLTIIYYLEWCWCLGICHEFTRAKFIK